MLKTADSIYEQLKYYLITAFTLSCVNFMSLLQHNRLLCVCRHVADNLLFNQFGHLQVGLKLA